MIKQLTVISLCVFALSSPAKAEEDAWRVQLSPYVWGPGLAGDIRLTDQLPEVEIDRSLSDVLSDLEAAFFLSGTARRERFVALADFTWAKLNENENLGIPATPLSPSFNLPLGLDIELMTAMATLGYSVVDRPGFVVDLLGGLRTWELDTTLKLQSPTPLLPSRLEDNESWVDPVVIARSRIRIAPNWTAILYAEVGGFDTGSDLTWQGLGTVNYQVSEAIFMSFGYRYLSLDYRDDGMKLDLQLGGPLAGLTYRF